MRASRALRRYLSIHPVSTPNPNSLKLVHQGAKLALNSPVSFGSATAALKSPLANSLFRVEGVENVLLASEYISVNKSPEAQWEALQAPLVAAIEAFFASGQGIFGDDGSSSPSPASDPHNKQQESPSQLSAADEETVALVVEIIETRVRPFVQEDGGDITFERFDPETGIVWVEMKGSCTGCPSSSVTLKRGVEGMLTHYVAEVKEVRLVNAEEEE